MLPLPSITVHIGDLIEFTHSSNHDDPATNTTKTSEGRVMDVDPALPHECVVQISPFEPFTRVDLSKAQYKIVYGIGELVRVTPEMIGWELEIPPNADLTTSPERGVIRQIDSSLNCVLLTFDDGHKDWRDLTMNAFKVVGRQLRATTSCNTSPVKQLAQQPSTFIQANAAVSATQTPIPATNVTQFDWFSEGGHVELCSKDGSFVEGAILCAQRDVALQLYNETRQFFEIHMRRQSFKVVVHGLPSVKSTVPLGQDVEIYSPMHGAFRRGTVMKAVDGLGKLTPVRFADVGIEWLDLTSQTFKLVFLVSATPPEPMSKDQAPIEKSERIRGAELAADKLTSHIQMAKPRQQASPNKSKELAASPMQMDSPPRQQHPHSHHHKHTHHELPLLDLGQTIEVLDPVTKQFVKYRVMRVLHPEKLHQYDIEAFPRLHNSSSGLLHTPPATQLTIDLQSVKARIVLTSANWTAYRPLLRGLRVDVYDKIDRSVLTGKIIDSSSPPLGAAPDADGDAVESGERVYVKLKDGSKRWFDIATTKIKLKLQGDRHIASHSTATETEKSVDDSKPAKSPREAADLEMWQRVDALPLADASSISPLARQQSEMIGRDSSPSSSPSARIARHASSPGIVRGVDAATDGVSSRGTTIPSLNFSSLRRSVVGPPTTLAELVPVETVSESRRSSGSNADALSDLLPPMDDVWTEEPTDQTEGQGSDHSVRYVHAATGQVQYERPQWLKTTDQTTSETVILNTITGVCFQRPGTSSSNTATPHTSGRGRDAVVMLPVGPLEAARVASQLNTTTTAATGIDLCAQAFGS